MDEALHKIAKNEMSKQGGPGETKITLQGCMEWGLES